MEKKTKIIVLRARELIYTGIFVGLGIMLLILILLMFNQNDTDTPETTDTMGQYTAGVYSTSVLLNGMPVNVSVTVDENHINAIELENVSESVTTMYPLLEPSLNDIASQICSTQSLDNLTYTEGSHYTSTLLIDAIDASLQKASASK